MSGKDYEELLKQYARQDFNKLNAIEEILDIEDEQEMSIRAHEQIGQLNKIQQILNHKLQYILTSKDCGEILDYTVKVTKSQKDLEANLETIQHLNQTDDNEISSYEQLSSKANEIENIGNDLKVIRRALKVCRLIRKYNDDQTECKEKRQDIVKEIEENLDSDILSISLIADAIEKIKLNQIKN